MDDNERALALITSLGIIEDVRLISASITAEIMRGIPSYVIYTLEIALDVKPNGIKKVMPIIKNNAIQYGMETSAIDKYIGVNATFQRTEVIDDQSIYGVEVLPDGS